MATDTQIQEGIADGRRCPSCRAYWTWCVCTQEMIDAVKAAHATIANQPVPPPSERGTGRAHPQGTKW